MFCLLQKENMTSTQLRDDLSEMESRSKMNDKEIARLKEEHQLMMKKLSRRRNEHQETLSQVRFHASVVSRYLNFHGHFKSTDTEN